MTHAELINSQQFKQEELLNLQPGSVALHLQPWPDAYPNREDQENHQLLSAAILCGSPEASDMLRQQVRDRTADYGNTVKSIIANNISLLRLCALPDSLEDRTRALVERAKISAENGEDVRFFKYGQQADRLSRAYTQLYEEPHHPALPDMRRLHFDFRVGNPNGGLWAIYDPHTAPAETSKPTIDSPYRWNITHGLGRLGTAAIIIYDETFRGFEIHKQPSAGIETYAKFWLDVHGDDEQSAGPDDYKRLYAGDYY